MGSGVSASESLPRARQLERGAIAWAALAGLLAIHAGLLAWGAYRHSPTLNEPAHLAAGIGIWKFGRFDLYRVNPPLVRMIAAAPVLAGGATIVEKDFGPRSILQADGIGIGLIRANGGERSFRLFAVARWACIPFSLLGGCACFCWARGLYGDLAGVLAGTLWCFSPNVIAHGQLITTDAAAAATGVTASYCFWRWLRSCTWTWALGTGVLLGVAQLTKMTWVFLFLLWPALWIAWRQMGPRRDGSASGWIREFAQLALMLIAGLYVLNLGYGFAGSFRRLGDYTFVSEALGGASSASEPWIQNRFAGTRLAGVRVPVPEDYLKGLDAQRGDFESLSSPSYLRGRFRDKGWWYYYLYGLGIKVPLGTWLLVLLAAAAGFGLGSPLASRRDEMLLLAPLVALLLLASSQTGFSHHFRYILPIFPFAFIWIGRLVPGLWRGHRYRVAYLAAGALVWGVASSLWIYPHSLAYFNEMVGGPAGGPRHMILSSIDWGQDVAYLRRWVERHPEARPLSVACYGRAYLKYVGLGYPRPTPWDRSRQGPDAFAVEPGWYAVSVNYLRGYPWQAPGDAYTYFQRMHPAERVGYSIYVYHVTQRTLIATGR